MMPSSIKSICRVGHHHDIEVEDDVTAILEYANGASGVFVTTTGEAPGTNRLEIVGTAGRLVADERGAGAVRPNPFVLAEAGRVRCASCGRLTSRPASLRVAPVRSPATLWLCRSKALMYGPRA